MMPKAIFSLHVPTCFPYVLLHINLVITQITSFSVPLYFRVLIWMNYIMGGQKLEMQLLIVWHYIFTAYVTVRIFFMEAIFFMDALFD